MKHNHKHWLSLQVQTQTRRLLGPKPVMAALPSLPPRLTPTPKRTLLKRTLHPAISNTATVTAVASQRAKSPAASVWLVTRESSVKSRRLDEATWPWSWGSSSSLLYWWLLLLFLLKGADHEEKCFILHPGKGDLLWVVARNACSQIVVHFCYSSSFHWLTLWKDKLNIKVSRCSVWLELNSEETFGSLLHFRTIMCNVTTDPCRQLKCVSFLIWFQQESLGGLQKQIHGERNSDGQHGPAMWALRFRLWGKTSCHSADVSEFI